MAINNVMKLQFKKKMEEEYWAEALDILHKLYKNHMHIWEDPDNEELTGWIERTREVLWSAGVIREGE